MAPEDDDPIGSQKLATPSARNMRTLAIKDMKGFKRSDSIEMYYDIQQSVGHGKRIELEIENFISQFYRGFR